MRMCQLPSCVCCTTVTFSPKHIAVQKNRIKSVRYMRSADIFLCVWLHVYNILLQTEVSVQRRKSWVRKLGRQLQKRAEVSSGKMFSAHCFVISDKKETKTKISCMEITCMREFITQLKNTRNRAMYIYIYMRKEQRTQKY